MANDKEIQFLNKKVRETENLNMKLITELSSKNQIIEEMTKKINELEYFLVL